MLKIAGACRTGRCRAWRAAGRSPRCCCRRCARGGWLVSAAQSGPLSLDWMPGRRRRRGRALGAGWRTAPAVEDAARRVAGSIARRDRRRRRTGSTRSSAVLVRVVADVVGVAADPDAGEVARSDLGAWPRGLRPGFQDSGTPLAGSSAARPGRGTAPGAGVVVAVAVVQPALVAADVDRRADDRDTTRACPCRCSRPRSGARRSRSAGLEAGGVSHEELVPSLFVRCHRSRRRRSTSRPASTGCRGRRCRTRPL